jgi:hypothetical protein
MMRSPSMMSRASAIAIRSFQLGASEDIAEIEICVCILDSTQSTKRVA